jgi:hypothetical protein
MPRETIPNDNPTDRFHMKVGWQSQGGVQVGVELSGDHGLVWTLFGENPEVRARLAMSLRALIAEGTSNLTNDALAERVLVAVSQSTDDFRGLWSHLDRHGCNVAIRTLRRARDAAFGRDE